ncbi:lysophospholipase [Hahella sp. HN01]|uniref:lysophospholipase n=1 Tax=Hahella sp. HN01 TaxID=2847262 RepID=UPI001C1EF9DF|nr:lysophospholipase [Hahella sp. HN01]MBU6954051.1 lysophospholipase [Hahella sp. HN01]
MKSQPKLVMLPGMDGTGDLFAPFLECIPQIETQIIPLPQTGAQDYDSLAAYVREQLPDGDFYLLAESFSGPIGALLAADGVPGLQGVIFVATFLSIPSPWAVCVGRRLPLQGVMRLPFSSWTQRRLLLGPDVGDDFLQHFTAAVRSIPTATLKARLETLQHLHWRHEPVSSPSIYLQATDDYLVSPAKRWKSNSISQTTVWCASRALTFCSRPTPPPAPAPCWTPYPFGKAAGAQPGPDVIRHKGVYSDEVHGIEAAHVQTYKLGRFGDSMRIALVRRV